MSYKCKFCGITHNGDFSNNFCCKSCACKWSNKLKYEKNPIKPRLETRICPKCGKEFTIDLRKSNKKFCSRKCANSRKYTEEQRKNISNSVKLSYKLNPKTEFQKCTGLTKKEYFEQQNKDTVPKIKDFVTTCVICGKTFESKNLRKTCSCECLTKLHEQLNKQQKNVQRIRYKTNQVWNENAYKQIYKFYYTYKITNLINGKYYLGIHVTNNLEDGYLGSGIAITKAIKKYGKENFKKEILQYFTCYKDLADAEYKLISDEVVNDINSYNMTRGGIGGPSFLGHKHSEQTKQKLSNIQKGKKHTEETKHKISSSQKGRTAWNKGLKKH